jgi:hypothetical protein
MFAQIHVYTVFVLLDWFLFVAFGCFQTIDELQDEKNIAFVATNLGFMEILRMEYQVTTDLPFQ